MNDLNFKPATIWTGDNLEIMRGMNSACVDLIYLDPPFNSGDEYKAPVGTPAEGANFLDIWHMDLIKHEEHGELAEKHPKLYSAIDAAGSSAGESVRAYLIFMGLRMLEMQRVLKPTGSIYLHCDPTAGHYLKICMDAVFGLANFRNEIVWKKNNGGKGSQHQPKKFGSIGDRILFYGATVDASKPDIAVPFDQEDPETLRKFPKVDKKGRRYNTATPLFSSRSMGARPKLCYEWRGFKNPHPSGWRLSKARLEEEFAKGNVRIEGGKLERRTYLDESKGKQLEDIWMDIPFVSGASKERTGYPTQKPTELLERIIKASSREGELVFDPFCGCATTLVAAAKLGRAWVGADVSPLAVELVKKRLAKFDAADLFNNGKVNPLDKPPVRTDLKPQLTPNQTIKQWLFGQQKGVCNGCHMLFPYKVFHIDHETPKSRGGGDHLENLQLLCSHCNTSKGGKTMPEWRAWQKTRDGTLLNG